MSLEQVCLIMDMDGFFVQKKFVPREIGFYSMTNQFNHTSIRFNLRSLCSSLDEKDKRHIAYCKKYIHGLSFEPMRDENHLYKLKDLHTIVKNLYYENRTDKKTFISYKGGHIEKDLLNELKIPNVNLEEFNCPKFKDLESKYIFEYDCGMHRKIDDGLIHCPLKEVFSFAKWIKSQSSE